MFNERQKARPSIKGTTTIDHRVCYALQIGFIEYVLLDYVNDNPGDIDQERLFSKKGLQFHVAVIFLRQLVTNQLLQQKSDGYYITSKWTQFFDVSHDFDNDSKEDPGFWQIFKRNGNKQTALKAYKKARKVVDKETLHKAATRYIKSKEGNDVFLHASTYLNPELRHWEDIIKIKDEQQNPTVLGTSITKKKA